MLTISGIDSHAHIFKADLPLAAQRRYAPGYDASVESHLSNMARNGLSHGVLVQPSFLGTDNSFMLEALRKYPDRFKGTAVVDPDISDATLDALETSGIVGVRLNLVGVPLEDFSTPRWQSFFTKIARRGWSVEIQRHVTDLAQILQAILPSNVALIVDHFGLPDGAFDTENVAHSAFLSLLRKENIWIKLSAAYRAKASLTQAKDMVHRFQDAYGHYDHLLWGSDWPHTRFEDQTTYDDQISFLQQLLTSSTERQKVLIDNPARIFLFDTPYSSCSKN